MKELWTEKYRPKDLDGYVFRDQAQKDQVASWIKGNAIPHLLFSGAPGVGKTTLAKILIHQLGIDEYDVLEINASRENSVDTIRDKITGFVQTMPFGAFKVVLLDEADYLTQPSQAALRNDMEAYHMTIDLWNIPKERNYLLRMVSMAEPMMHKIRRSLKPT